MKEIKTTHKEQDLICFFISTNEWLNLQNRLREISKGMPEDKRYRIRDEQYFELHQKLIQARWIDNPKVGVQVIYDQTTGKYTSKIATEQDFRENLGEMEFEDFVSKQGSRPIFFW